jgi:hypothetical protein
MRQSKLLSKQASSRSGRCDYPEILSLHECLFNTHDHVGCLIVSPSSERETRFTHLSY